MLFAHLHEKLIARVRDRVRSGEITERGLAKLTGLSQPHVHNVLKGARSLSTESADLIARHLEISVLSLLKSGPSQRQTPPKLDSDSINGEVWVTLGPDPEIFPYFQEGDLALIGRAPETLSFLDPDSVYLVKTENKTVLRALRIAGSRLYLITPKTAYEPRLWTPLPLGGREIGDVIIGKLIRINRELRPNPFGIERPVF